mmetsp:Transcript_85462/g.259343  ORF Transcript_85462/g.259343 Transcript_85462/m.259343 type:complete len:217 (+) Transcript_85462:1241-1891(+)
MADDRCSGHVQVPQDTLDILDEVIHCRRCLSGLAALVREGKDLEELLILSHLGARPQLFQCRTPCMQLHHSELGTARKANLSSAVNPLPEALQVRHSRLWVNERTLKRGARPTVRDAEGEARGVSLHQLDTPVAGTPELGITLRQVELVDDQDLCAGVAPHLVELERALIHAQLVYLLLRGEPRRQLVQLHQHLRWAAELQIPQVGQRPCAAALQA